MDPEHAIEWLPILQLSKAYQKLRAPNSWEDEIHYLKKYVLNFFLGEKKSNNVNEWRDQYEDFKIWLTTVKPLKHNVPSLALNTQNRIITALNNFMTMLHKKGELDSIVKLEKYAEREDTQVTIDDLYTEVEIEKVFAALCEINLTSAELFLVMARSGLRLNEALGLSLNSIIPGTMGGGEVSLGTHNMLSNYGLGVYKGYIILESQPSLKSVRVKKSEYGTIGTVPRKPLKHRKSISTKWNRYIPIHNLKAWECIKEAFNFQLQQSERMAFGTDKKDYLLFDNLTASKFYAHLVRACENTKTRFRNPHCLRHTYLTWFYGKTNEDRVLAERIAGHVSQPMIQRYSHVRQQMGIEQERVQKSMTRIE